MRNRRSPAEWARKLFSNTPGSQNGEDIELHEPHPTVADVSYTQGKHVSASFSTFGCSSLNDILQFYFTAEQERHKKEKEEEKKKKKKAELEEAKEKEKERKKKKKAAAGSSRHGLVTSSGTHQSGGAAQAQHLSSQPNAVCISSNAPVVATTSADAIPMTLPPDRTKRQGYWASFCLWLYLRCTCANSTESS